jgi:phospholipid-translocating ATPase
VKPEELAEKLAVLKDSMLPKLTMLFKHRYVQIDKLAEDLSLRSSKQYLHLIAFFRALAVWHSVLADKLEPQEGPFFFRAPPTSSSRARRRIPIRRQTKRQG